MLQPWVTIDNRTLRGGARTERVVGDARALFADSSAAAGGNPKATGDGKDDFPPPSADAEVVTTEELKARV